MLQSTGGVIGGLGSSRAQRHREAGTQQRKPVGGFRLRGDAAGAGKLPEQRDRVIGLQGQRAGGGGAS
jgi:hypothetical protein